MRTPKSLAFLAVILISQLVFAQAEHQEADNGSGVVLGVLAIAFAGLFVYLLRIDLKLRKMEEELRKRKE
jgi:CcmD family protein